MNESEVGSKKKKKKKIQIFVSKSEFLESILWKYQEWTDYETKISYTSQEIRTKSKQMERSSRKD